MSARLFSGDRSPLAERICRGPWACASSITAETRGNVAHALSRLSRESDRSKNRNGLMIVMAPSSACARGRGWGRSGEREGERRAFTGPAFGPDPAAVPPDRPFDDRQPDPRAFELLPRVQAPERHEHPLGKPLLETDPVVLHEEDGLAVLLERPEFDAGEFFVRGEFPGIPEQIRQRDLDQLRVGAGRDAFSVDELDAAVRLLLAEPRTPTRRSRSSRPPAGAGRGARSARDAAVVDDPVHPLGAVHDPAQMFSPPLVELVRDP